MAKLTLDDRKLRALIKRLGRSDRRVRVGVLASKGGLEDHDGISMVELMAIHEFGTATVPQRAPIRSTFEGKERELARISMKLAKQMILNGMTHQRALEVLGAWGVAKVQANITQGPSLPPPLAESTVRRKGSSRALVDTGRLVGSLAWEVEQ